MNMKITKTLRRVIRITVSAKGKGLEPESIALVLRPIEDEKALDLYRRINLAVDAILKNR